MSGLFLYHAAVAAFAVLLLGTSLLNALTFRKPNPVEPNAALPMVSVLVPARNEERCIEACVRSLLRLDYPHYEVVVLDDHSTDRTYEILDGLRREDPRLRVLSGKPLEPGWCGKPHACWQLAEAAVGEYLLLTDADCTFAPNALLDALGGLRDHRADVISLCPDLLCEGFWEKLILPMQYSVIFLFLPTPLIRLLPFPSLAAANGAFLFLKKRTYFELDGHRAVRAELAEDIKFAQHVKRSGRTFWYGDGTASYSVRMYHGLAELWAGFTKNIFPAMGRNLFLLTMTVLSLTAVFVLPPFWAAWGVAHRAAWVWLPLATYLGMAGVRLGLMARFRHDRPWNALLHPLGWATVAGIAINSAYRALSHHGTAWKGRVYTQPSEDAPIRHTCSEHHLPTPGGDG